MRVLAIREPWASLIISGQKTIELRTRRTYIRERIAIYASRTQTRKRDLKYLREEGNDTPDKMQKGHIIGTVELADCVKLTENKLVTTKEHHMTNPVWYGGAGGINEHAPVCVFGWKLKDPIQITPFEWKMKRGAVVWGSIDEKTHLHLGDNQVFTNDQLNRYKTNQV